MDELINKYGFEKEGFHYTNEDENFYIDIHDLNFQTMDTSYNLYYIDKMVDGDTTKGRVLYNVEKEGLLSYMKIYFRKKKIRFFYKMENKYIIMHNGKKIGICVHILKMYVIERLFQKYDLDLKEINYTLDLRKIERFGNFHNVRIDHKTIPYNFYRNNIFLSDFLTHQRKVKINNILQDE